MIRSFKVFFILISPFLLFSPTLSFAEHFTVKHIDDGDTIICENQDITIRVRLAGINAPETSKDKRDAGQPFSLQARQVLEKLILDKIVDVKGYGLDDYNRLIGLILLNGKNINLEMVQQGMAEAYKGRSPNGFDIEPYRKAEKEARGSLRGIWSQGDKYISPGQWRKTQTED
jgi:micrococcal nuclease